MYVLLNYKTEQCKRPPRLCRQGYACPQYHNLRDRRRSPKKFKYRSTPCPNVKHGDEWGEPTMCEDGDDCHYCHTRTEQQFHPEIYKSSKVCPFAFVDSDQVIFMIIDHFVSGSSVQRRIPKSILSSGPILRFRPQRPGNDDQQEPAHGHELCRYFI